MMKLKYKIMWPECLLNCLRDLSYYAEVRIIVILGEQCDNKKYNDKPSKIKSVFFSTVDRFFFVDVLFIA